MARENDKYANSPSVSFTFDPFGGFFSELSAGFAFSSLSGW